MNIYCDESGHLEHSPGRFMVLGALSCPAGAARDVAEELRALKSELGVAPRFEVKWTKVSPARTDLYIALVNYFLSRPDLRFRALIADRTLLRHDAFQQTHDDWYYKMYFSLLRPLIPQDGPSRVFVDVKDTRGATRVRKLHDVLCNAAYDFDKEMIQIVQQVRSHEVEQMQLADLLIGAVAFANRDGEGSEAKATVTRAFKEGSGLTLKYTTSLGREKVNIFQWQPGVAT